MKNSGSIPALIILFILIIHSPPEGLSNLKLMPVQAGEETDCTAVMKEFDKEGDWNSELVNPILKTESQVTDMVSYFHRVIECLDEDENLPPTDKQSIRRLSEYFLVFAGGDQTEETETSLSLVKLGSSSDPAVKSIREEAGIPSPPGYIFVRFYSSRDAMPPIIHRAFQDETIAGVTMFSRYIAILDDEKNAWPLQALHSLTMPKTISHELVHAYVIASIGTENSRKLPTWYHEGVAIYFSGSGKGNSIMAPDFSISTTSPEDYAQYDLNFQYLEKMHGRQHLLGLIRHSIEKADPSLLYQELGIQNYQDMVEKASAWKQKNVTINAGIGLSVMLIAGLLLYMLMPDVRCENCGFTGRKKVFKPGYCPECLYRYEQSNKNQE